MEFVGSKTRCCQHESCKQCAERLKDIYETVILFWDTILSCYYAISNTIVLNTVWSGDDNLLWTAQQIVWTISLSIIFAISIYNLLCCIKIIVINTSCGCCRRFRKVSRGWRITLHLRQWAHSMCILHNGIAISCQITVVELFQKRIIMANPLKDTYYDDVYYYIVVFISALSTLLTCYSQIVGKHSKGPQQNPATNDNSQPRCNIKRLAWNLISTLCEIFQLVVSIWILTLDSSAGKIPSDKIYYVLQAIALRSIEIFDLILILIAIVGGTIGFYVLAGIIHLIKLCIRRCQCCCTGSNQGVDQDEVDNILDASNASLVL